MHNVALQGGELDAERELRLIEQSPAEFLFLSAADTELAAAASAWQEMLGARKGGMRITHLGPLRQPVSADDYIERVVRRAKLVVMRLLGGESYFPHLVQGLRDLRENGEGPRLILLPGSDPYDAQLADVCDLDAQDAERLFALFQQGGAVNLRCAGKAILNMLEGTAAEVADAELVAQHGLYFESACDAKTRRKIWVTFYRAWYLADDLEVIDALIAGLEAEGFFVVAFYAQTLKESATQDWLLQQADHEMRGGPDVLITLQSFAVSAGGTDEKPEFLHKLSAPILQAFVSTQSRERWEKSRQGLSPSEVAMNLALPELDGRIGTTVIGFREQEERVESCEFERKKLRAAKEQIQYVARLASAWSRLRHTENSKRRVAVILSNYPNRDGRIGNGVGLDTPASAVALLRRLKERGYDLGEEALPADGDALIARLTRGVTNDRENSYGKVAEQTLRADCFGKMWQQCAESRRAAIEEKWGAVSLEKERPIAAVCFGNVLLGIQPARGYEEQTQAIYHSPELPPPPSYLAFYFYLRAQFDAHAVVHLGKHGNLEWLPGRATALGAEDDPQMLLGATPHFYPFIVNNPGEGTQAKRRTHSVIIDHLTPPLRRAGLYGELERAERLLEQVEHAATFLPSRRAELEQELLDFLKTVSWREELPRLQSGADEIEALGLFLCEIKESRIRSALHILGRAPEGEQLLDQLSALLRPGWGKRSGLQEILETELAASGAEMSALNRAEIIAARERDWCKSLVDSTDAAVPDDSSELAALRKFACENLLPKLAATAGEIDALLDGLEGKPVLPGPAGAPTRGRLDVLPTGRNFYAIDPRVVPTPSAWRCGKEMAERLLEKHRLEHGRDLKTLALVIWGTSNMRTGGDDIAQALWLWGCEPQWDEQSGRVVDFDIVPAALLGRPRVDVLVRASGLFRDAFGDLMRLLAAVPKRLAELDEPAALNPIRETYLLAQKSHDSVLRVFSSAPGNYGAGLLQAIQSGAWETRADLASVFIRWGDHAYPAQGEPREATALLKERLAQTEAVHQNQDNREHDILDSDDYFQFQGGLAAAVETLRGAEPAVYHGDSSAPEKAQVRTLREEVVKVVRSRVLNPRWLAAMRQHGYKGAFEMAATVDYLFGYGATTEAVRPAHFEETCRALLLEAENAAFFRRSNPHAYRDSLRRMLEAAERGVWREAAQATVQELQDALACVEGDLE